MGNVPKKIAAINDMSGYGRCSLAVEIPVISAMRVQCCPLPTSIFSNHTGYDSFYFDDYTDRMEAYFAEWEKLGVHFDGICTGFLGSPGQIRIVERFFDAFASEDTVVVVDPVMGDHGKRYRTYSEEACAQMRRLIRRAQIITPNLTEACILADRPYRERWRRDELFSLAQALSEQGPEKIVITGIPQGSYIADYCYRKGGETRLFRTKRIGQGRPGTGDIFCAVIAADAVNGTPFEDSVKKASRFIRRCIMRSEEMGIPVLDGVCFEEFLGTLK